MFDNLSINQVFRNRSSKLLNISHKDFDGAVCSILMKKIYRNIDCKYAEYDGSMPYDFNKYDGVIFTDFTPKTFDNIHIPYLVIDHHESVKHLNNEKNVFIKIGYCGAALVYKYYNKFVNFAPFGELIETVNDYDMWHLKDYKKAFTYNMLFWKYGFQKFTQRFSDGNLTLTEEEELYIMERFMAIKEQLKSTQITELPSNGIFYVCVDNVSEVSYFMEKKMKPNYAIFMIKPNRISLRSYNDRINLVEINKSVNASLGTNVGGGHEKAIGVYIEDQDMLKKYMDAFVNNVNEVLK
ncbi:MAG: hypothetical protein MJZ34_08230 [Paludibacteraceae bacterium]|nr:hypothetical protein [Paludibacteraceae bacterium]